MFRRTLISTALAAVALATPAASAAQPSGVEGVWRNPKNSVHIRIQPCGEHLCGYVVWATEDAKEDARKGGTANLVGSQLLRNFSPSKSGSWRGRVFVPDLNATFSGSAQLVDENTLRARGCLIAGLGCKSQNWKRIS
ncbi:DUF2147 domain-containing protein [Phenylobacterium sp. SCN 70-31]|uniref:DUF2147 domain-containing protein n=1 Tax=Phenylobacterium sp. SCN 70-31 TaxID=1660129 RepID=UPI00086F8169|nr:DUF2147 domain-containing protein [Phenylobacterium sp. SCN 70-31]ODT88655.1 MAG: hypothetical protein ABS78_05710 [Phenylobacterium sp. SCN 70-31]